jgi:hypothetical protein
MLAVIAVEFDKLREIHVHAESLKHGGFVEMEAISRQLNAIGEASRQFPTEHPSRVHGSLADAESGNELRIGINGDENPLVALLIRYIAFVNAAIFLLYKRPDFIAFDAAALQRTHSLVQQRPAAGSRCFKQRKQCRFVQASNARDGANAHSFHHEREGLGCDLRRGVVSSQLGNCFAESGFAGSATPTLNPALAVGSESLCAVVGASDAGHGFSPLDFCGEKPQNLFGSESWLTPRFGLAPPPVQAGSGALSKSYGLGWRLNRDSYGLTDSEANLNSDNHAVFILPESPAATGLSYLASKSILRLWRRWNEFCRCPVNRLATPVAVVFDLVLFYKPLENRMNGGEHIGVSPSVVASSFQFGFHFDYAIIATLNKSLDDSFGKAQVIFRRIFLAQHRRQSNSRLFQTGNLFVKSLLILEALTELFAAFFNVSLQLFEDCFVIGFHAGRIISCLNKNASTI